MTTEGPPDVPTFAPVDPARLPDLRTLLARHGASPQKRLGQCFLVSPSAADHIVATASVSSGDRVIEIGAGAGALTLRLAQLAADVTAIELDQRLVSLLSQMLVSFPNTRVVHADVLKLDFAQLLAADHWKLLGNLPYYITGPTLAKLLACRRSLDLVIVMVQKEVAERIVSSPGRKSYGALSVMLQAYFRVHRESIVKRGSFFPAPEVDSAVVSLTPLNRPVVPPSCETAFEAAVRAAFAHRRKTLENSLVDAGSVSERRTALEVLDAAGLSAGRRAEVLSIEEFVRLAEELARRGVTDPRG